MHISKNLKSVLARAPVLFMMLSIITVCHPVRAQAAGNNEHVLKKDMDHFETITEGTTKKWVIESNGDYIKQILGISGLKDESQYFAYFKLDKKNGGGDTWSTKTEYWHKYRFPKDSSGNITIPDGTPQHSLSANGVVFSANAGLYGSLYKTDDNVYYEYDKSPNLPVVTDTRPGTYITNNNNNNEGGIYLTKTGHDKYVETGDTYKADSADRTIGGDNTLVCYAIYEDIFDNWNNEQYNPKPNVPDDKNPKTEEKKSFYWNWVLPNGFVWDSVDIEKDDTVDETKYENEYTSPFIAQVMGTNTSAVFDAQQGIPTTEFVRTQAQVPRYLTRGYYNKEMIDWAYTECGCMHQFLYTFIIKGTNR